MSEQSKGYLTKAGLGYMRPHDLHHSGFSPLDARVHIKPMQGS